jgi:hypothetical protein
MLDFLLITYNFINNSGFFLNLLFEPLLNLLTKVILKYVHWAFVTSVTKSYNKRYYFTKVFIESYNKSDVFYKMSNTRSLIQAYVFGGKVIRTIKNYHTRRHFACLLCVVSVVQFCFPFAHNTLNVRYWYWWQWSEPVSRRSTSMTRRGWRAWRNCLKEVDSLPSTYRYACYRTLILSGWCVLCLWICGLL